MSKYLLIVFAVLVAFGGLYWFQIRPSKLKRECFNSSKVKNLGPVSSTNKDFPAYKAYLECLNKSH
jgi:hypothetical protein